MANMITASIYSFQSNPDFTDQYGVKMGFNTSSIIIKPLDPTQTFQGTVCNSTIEIVTLKQPFPMYYAAETAATLIYGGNY